MTFSLKLISKSDNSDFSVHRFDERGQLDEILQFIIFQRNYVIVAQEARAYFYVQQQIFIDIIQKHFHSKQESRMHPYFNYFAQFYPCYQNQSYISQFLPPFLQEIQKPLQIPTLQTPISEAESSQGQLKVKIEERPELVVKKSSEKKKSKLIAKIQRSIRLMHSSTKPKNFWTHEEDTQLLRLVSQDNFQWKSIIHRHFPNRDYLSCYRRYHLLMKENPKRQKYLQQNDLLVQLVEKYGQNWQAIKEHMPKYHVFQLRDRYQNRLRPELNKSPPSYQEDLKIIQLVLQKGNNWEQFEYELRQKNRSKGWIKSRYYNRLNHIVQNCMNQLDYEL